MGKRKKRVDDYHEAVGLSYNGDGEYIINIPMRDLSVLDVVETAARLDMSVGEFTGLVTVQAKNKNGEALYIIPVEATQKVETRGDNDNEPIQPMEDIDND